MKKTVLSLILLLGIVAAAFACPALPGKFKRIQPDGSVIILENHGDEYFHFLTDDGGQIVEKGADGFYRPVGESISAYRARKTRSGAYRPKPMSRWSSYDNPFPTNFGDRRVLCILANFTDSTYVLDNPREKFSNMLNQEGYSYDGAIGSVRDYYLDNSLGKYRPTFDVYGPVQVSGSSAYYDQNGAHLAILEAYELLKDQIPIEDYDTDNDGKLDMVLFYYPGHNQAENAGEESIWPHQSTGDFGMMGSKRFVRYFCTSECRGESGADMCGIGTTCHEFAHSLGLPDSYDTDYEENGYNYLVHYSYDLMDYGNYKCDGKVPPYLNSVERNMLGWMDNFEEISETGSYTLLPVQQNKAYKSLAKTQGEYFVYNYRNGQKWDADLPPGLVVYRIDKSNRLVGGGLTAAELWEETNRINAYGGHPCFDMLRSAEALEYISDFVFPGRMGVTSLTPLDVDGSGTGLTISDISISSTSATFNVTMDGLKYLTGTVKNSQGSPIANAEVVLSLGAYPFVLNAAPGHLRNDIVTYTDSHGHYEFYYDMDKQTNRVVTVRADGFIPASVNLEMTDRCSWFDFVLLGFGEGPKTNVKRFDENTSVYFPSYEGQTELAWALYLTQDEIHNKGLNGNSIQSVTFAANAVTYEKVYIVIEYDDERVLFKDVTKQYARMTWCQIDLSEENILIPDVGGVIIGWAISGLPDDSRNVPVMFMTDENFGGPIVSFDILSSNQWYYASFGGYYFEPAIMVTTAANVPTTPSMFELSYISIENDIPTLVANAAKTVKSVSWELDGVAVSSPQALSSASAGEHLYIAEVLYYDGTSESVFYQFTK